MGFFRRRNETLNERLLREAGLDRPPEPERAQGRADSEPAATSDWGAAAWPAAAASTLNRPREWDALVTVDAPGVAGDVVEFAVPDGQSLLVDEEQGDNDLSPLADAVERELAPPYRARGTRQERTIWAVGARRIEVARLKTEGDSVDVTMRDGDRTAAVDGEPTSRSFPELERLGERAGGDYTVHAERLDGDLWEVQVSAL